MIKTKGYYLDRPRHYNDNTGGNAINGFCHIAYKFNDDGSFFIRTKYTSSKLSIFSESDFEKKRQNKYSIDKNKIKLIFNSDKEYSHELCIKIHDELTLYDEDKLLKFIAF